MTRMLNDGGVEAASSEAVWLLAGVTGKTRAQLVLDEEVSDDDETAALTLAARRIDGEPLQYLTGTAAFRRLDLMVGPGVFIPRPETELVAELAMEKLPSGGTVVDVGTGSGAMALAIADERPDASVYATEASKEAMRWARKNIKRLGREDSVVLVGGDLMEELPEGLRGAVDVVVSNPPYVSWDHRHRLPADVVEHEPPEALFAADGGRTVTGRLASEARAWLRPGGWLVIEIAEDQGAAVANLLESRGYDDVAIRPDLAGRDRIALGRRSG